MKLKHFVPPVAALGAFAVTQFVLPGSDPGTRNQIALAAAGMALAFFGMFLWIPWPPVDPNQPYVPREPSYGPSAEERAWRRQEEEERRHREHQRELAHLYWLDGKDTPPTYWFGGR